MTANKKFFSLSLKQILILVVPLVIVAMYTCISFTFIANKIIEAAILRVVDGINEKIDGEVRLTFEPPAIALDTLADAISTDQNPRNISNLVKSASKSYPQCLRISYGTAATRRQGGYILSNDDWESPADFDHTATDWFKGAKDANGKIFASEPHAVQPSGETCITFARSVFNRQNEFIGVISADLMLKNLSEVIDKIKVSSNTTINLVDGTGTYLTHKNPDAILQKNYMDEGKLDKKKYPAALYFNGSTKAFIQGKYFFAVRRIGVSPWFAVVDGHVADFTSTINKYLYAIISTVAVLILACVVLNAVTQTKTNKREKKVSDKIFTEMQNLIVAAKENAATAQDQSAAVKEIVATMEDNTAQSENISKKIVDVADVAKNTSGDVVTGVTYLEENVKQLTEIAEANQKTIDGIKSLGDRIENIWDIVTLINSVADQAKIIAFNAELEASSAGEAGRNFHIVATEIRRLADGIIDGTKEIKSKITEIQQSSDSLILASESGTEKIQDGVENAKNLEKRFTSIKNASEVTAGSAGEITKIIQQQAMASEQILITLKQIAGGIENFSAATENISQASQNLKMIAGELAQQHENAAVEEE
ncbi:MAG: hypothetical protein IKN90_08050 [Treponema sp.]|nr:hypothetical protein [Treponema sp.]